MNDTARNDVWAQGDGYERYVGRWSRLVAVEFLRWISTPPQQTWLDVGCGTGALSQSILKISAPAKVVGVDSSDGFVAHARAHVSDPRAEFRVGDARALPADDSSFDAVVSGLVLNFVPDQRQAIMEMRRAARPDATVAVYVWDYAGEMQLMRKFWDVAITLDSKARELDEGLRFPVCRPDALRDLFAEAGLRGVSTHAIDVATVFRDFEDYWSPFLSGQGPAPGYCMALAEADRERLRESVRLSLPPAPDGTISLIARAWAVQGRA
ncbi:MAG TPA: class I SAM-dependent methyltransferase [Pseudolabrys sp.]|nr:class I SAM-dependent methyltransferase [Pseudolabrys sp.]